MRDRKAGEPPPRRQVLLNLRFVPGKRKGTGLLHQCIRKSGSEAPDTPHPSLGGAADQHAAALAPHHAGRQCQSGPGESRHRYPVPKGHLLYRTKPGLGPVCGRQSIMSSQV